jgi:hypothetical protein
MRYADDSDCDDNSYMNYREAKMQEKKAFVAVESTKEYT